MSDKLDAVVSKLRADWVEVPALLQETGWKHTSLRGTLSALAKKLPIKIERKRTNGVTSYKIIDKEPVLTDGADCGT